MRSPARPLVDFQPMKYLGGVAHGGFSEKEMRAAHQVVLDAMPMTVKCEFCRYRYQGAAGRALVLMARHRARRHPEVVTGSRRERERARAALLAERRRLDSERRAAA